MGDEDTRREIGMRYEYVRKPRKCPSCGAASVARILYGFPDMSSEELRDDLDAGRVVLGGCALLGVEPDWQCVSCEVVMYRRERDRAS